MKPEEQSSKPSQTETTYTPAPEELIRARKIIAGHSFQRSIATLKEFIIILNKEIKV